MFVSSDTHVFESADDIICINISGDKFSLDTPLYICLCYVVPENSCRHALIEMHTFDRLTDFIAELYSKHDGNNCNCVLCCDMNSRTSNCPDYIVNDCINVGDVLPDDYVTDVPLVRCSEQP